MKNVVLEEACRLQSLFVEQGWRFCVIGGIAVQKWGEPRVTDDVDITLITGFGGELPFIETLLAVPWLRPRREDAADFALRRRVLLLETDRDVGVDIAMGAFPFEEAAADRAVAVELAPGFTLRICTAEDFIIYKTFAARALDWHDVKMTIVRQGDENLDWRYIREQLEPLLELKGQPDLLDELDALRRRLLRRPQP